MKISQKFNDMKWLRRSAAVAIMLLIGLHNALDMVRAWYRDSS